MSGASRGSAANAGRGPAPCARCDRALTTGRGFGLRRRSGAAEAPASERVCLPCALRDRATVRRSLRVALVVGTILNLGNQGAGMFDPATVQLGKLLFTYLVPYFVATYGALANARE